MTDPGIYLVNATGEMTPLVTEDSRDEQLFHDVQQEQIHPHRCPNCLTTIRATGGAEKLYETDRDMNAVVHHDLSPLSPFDPRDASAYLHYCPNPECRVWRLFPTGMGINGE